MNYIKAIDPKYRGFLSSYKSTNWSLSVGAGICFGILPTWSELTRRILSQVKGVEIEEDQFLQIVSKVGWSLDSIIQLCLNEFKADGKSIEEFYSLLQKELYSDLINTAIENNIRDPLIKFISNPFTRTEKDILPLCNFFRTIYGNTSLVKLCDFLIDAKNQDKNPNAILNFNADVLLHSVLTLFQIEEEYNRTGKYKVEGFHYKAIHKIRDTNGQRIPIYHLHGSIVPNENMREARHNLVFLESSYSDVAGSMSSWQHSIFQYYTQRSRLVFIGLSMSDSNIRRWLSWVSKILSDEVFIVTKEEINVQKHLWLTTEPKNTIEFDIKANGLSHLGVKTGFIPTWMDLDAALKNILSFD